MYSFKYFQLLLLGLALLTYSCQKASKEVLNLSDFGEPVSLTAMRSDSIVGAVAVFGLYDCGDYIVTRAPFFPKRQHSFLVLSKSDFSVVDSLCPKGEGPDEYRDPSICGYNYKTGNLFVFEPDKMLLREVNLAESLASGATVAKKQSSLPNAGKRIVDLYTAENGDQLAYVLEGDFFSLYQVKPNEALSKELLRSEPMQLSEQYLPSALYLTQSQISFNPQKALAFTSANCIPSFSLVDLKKGVLKNFYYGEKLTLDEAAERKYDEGIDFNWDILSSDKYVYVGYRVDRDAPKEQDKRHILVFDWEGKPVKHLILPEPAKSLGISQDGKTLYALHEQQDKAELSQAERISQYEL